MEEQGVADYGSSTGALAHEQSEEEMMELRRGPWTVEEDLTLINYITLHGEGRWNSLARCSGLKRTGKSCRLRWLNYLRPDVRRGNITPEEQLLILELHSRWGNRWSKIAQHLPGRTDNEIKNYWRTRVQKHAKQLQCDVNSKKFKDVMRYLWMPRLLERIRAASGACPPSSLYDPSQALPACPPPPPPADLSGQLKPSPESSESPESTLDSAGTPVGSPFGPDHLPDCYSVQGGEITSGDGIQDAHVDDGGWPELVASMSGDGNQGLWDLDQCGWGGDMAGNLWNVEDIWF